MPISTRNSIDTETLGSLENAASRIPLIDLLRGHDGLPGRDGERRPQGEQGPPGPQGIQGLPGPRSTGVTYIRWGKSSCPNTPGTEEVYIGRAGGTAYANRGEGAEKLCLPNQPQYINGTQSMVAKTNYVVAVMILKLNWVEFTHACISCTPTQSCEIMQKSMKPIIIKHSEVTGFTEVAKM